MSTTASKNSAVVNATVASLLGFLHERPMTGWDLVAYAQKRIGSFWSLTSSQVYRELATMAQAGLIKAERKGTRDKQPYAITKAGRAAFNTWIDRDPGEENIRFPLLLTVTFGRHIPKEKLTRIVTSHRNRHQERLHHYDEMLDDPSHPVHQDAFAIAALEFGVRYERATLDWFQALPSLLAREATTASTRRKPSSKNDSC